MKKEFAMAWVKALRSGKYKQCKNKLADGTRFCCLGVLNQINGREVRGLVALSSEDLKYYRMYSGDGAKRDKSKINIDDVKARSLANANDFHGVSFRKIAAWIEKNYKKL